MIPQGELAALRAEWTLDQGVIERDYVLGWLLAGIAHHDALNRTWVFKGGTCLRKCYYETFRFSEDLDFTIVDGGPEEPDELTRVFGEIAEWLLEESGIDLVLDERSFQRRQNRRGQPTTQGRIAYRGPNGNPNMPKVKLDLTSDEVLVDRPVLRPVGHPYSDQLPGTGVLCYSITELFGRSCERSPSGAGRAISTTSSICTATLISLASRPLSAGCSNANALTRESMCPPRQRSRPRRSGPRSRASGRTCSATSCPGRSHPLRVSGMRSTTSSRGSPGPGRFMHSPGRRSARSRSGRRRRRSRRGVGRCRSNCCGMRARIASRSTSTTAPERGRQGARRVEPYSLRYTQDGNLVLFVVNDQGFLRSYRVDRIAAIRPTSVAFTPRFRVEF